MDIQPENNLKKNISSDFLATYGCKIFGFILSVFLLWCIKEVISEPIRLKTIFYIVICLMVSFHSMRFSWFAKIVSMDETFFYISGIGKELKLPIITANGVDQTIFMKIGQPVHAIITFNLSNHSKKRVIFIPNEKASKKFIHELNNIINEKKRIKEPKGTSIVYKGVTH